MNLLLQTVAELGVVIFNALDFGLKVISSDLTISCFWLEGHFLSYHILSDLILSYLILVCLKYF